MKTQINQIREILDQQRTFLRKTYNVESLGVFGSVARGDNTETSDIDVLVQFSEPIGMFKFIQLEDRLSQLFGKKVDLVTNKALKEVLKDEILQEVLYV